MMPPTSNDMDTVPTPSTSPSAHYKGAGEILRLHKASLDWEIMGMRGLLVQFHPANCTACNDYVEHAVNASRKHEIDCPPKDVEKAVQDAWPAYVYTIGERVRDEMRDELQDVQEKHNRLANKYDDLFADYKKLKASKAERDDIIDQLKREIEELKAPQLSTPYPGGFNGVLDITSDEEFEAKANRPASPAAQSSSTGVSRHDKLAGKKKRAKAVAPYPKGVYRTHTVVVDPPISETGVPPPPAGQDRLVSDLLTRQRGVQVVGREGP